MLTVGFILPQGIDFATKVYERFEAILYESPEEAPPDLGALNGRLLR